MTTSAPLYVVLTVLILLWTAGWLLNRIQSKSSNSRENIPHGTKITPYLHVSGLNESQCNELKAILNHADSAILLKFIAYYQPHFLELDRYIGTLREKYLEILGKPLEKATEIEKIAAATRITLDNQPYSFDFGLLTRTELRTIYEYNPVKQRSLNEKFVKDFGDTNFLENFNAYKQLLTSDAGNTVQVTKTEPHRALLETLANNGVVRRGRRIELKDRLRVLTLEQLNNMAKELKINKIYQSHENAVQGLAEIPGSAILLAMIYSIEDLFFLNPKTVDVKAIQQEINLWNCFVKLIAQIPRQQAQQRVPLTQRL